jgi:hypothetical protein
MSLLSCCEVKFGFLIPHEEGLQWSHHQKPAWWQVICIERNDPRFFTSNLKMSIQTLFPRFDVIHQWICFIELYKNVMMFW